MSANEKNEQKNSSLNFSGQMTTNIDMQSGVGDCGIGTELNQMIGGMTTIMNQTGTGMIGCGTGNVTGTGTTTTTSTSSIIDFSGKESISDGNLMTTTTTGNTIKFGTTQIDFQNIKAATDTLKRNPKIEFNRSDLLKLLSYLEGELQARDVVIAALKSEKVKQLLHTTRYKPLSLNDPHAALFRDNLATSGNIASRQSSTAAAQTEQEMRLLADQQMESLENLIMQQRQTQMRMVNVLRDAEDKHKRLMQELEEEKRKHERDTAQGDDITYGLEMERTRLKQELESEKTNKKKFEKELKKQQEILESERGRQKQIVLLLLAERKKIIMKYIEERKRSEDLAQILSEEKQRVDTIAEGLEEESKKSLRMEAELEKQMYQFENERKIMKINLGKEEKRVKDQESELIQLKTENELLRKQVANLPPRLMGVHPPVPQLPAKTNVNSSRSVSDPLDESTASPMMSSVAKVVQPTATVTSVPVSGPTTGIARSISPGQSLRQTPINDSNNFNTTKARKLQNSTTGITGTGLTATTGAGIGTGTGMGTGTVTTGVGNVVGGGISGGIITSVGNCNVNPSGGGGGGGVTTAAATTTTTTAVTAAGAGACGTVGGNTIMTSITGTTTSVPNTLSKMSAAVAATTIISPPPPPLQSLKKINSNVLGRGVPPPIPPNKPVVPPKREPNVSRLSGYGQTTVGGIPSVSSSSPPIVSPGTTGQLPPIPIVTTIGLSTAVTTATATSTTTQVQVGVTGTSLPQSSQLILSSNTSPIGLINNESLDEELNDFQQVLCSMVNK